MPRQLRSLVCSSALRALPACYDYVPVQTTPTVGEQIALDVTDKGRVELADRFGQGLLRVQGKLAADSGEQYVMNVYGVTEIDGSSSVWSGERLRIPHEYVAQVRGRELSKGKTAVAAVAATAAVVGFIASRTLTSSGAIGTDPGGPGTGGPTSIRIHPFHRSSPSIR